MSGRENPYERKFDQGYARRDNAGGYTFRHAGPGSEPHSSDFNRSSKSGKSNQSTKSAKEKRDARILANDFTQSPEDSFEDAHDRTFLELPQAEPEVLHGPIGRDANSEPAAGLVHPIGASPVFFPAITPDHGASSPALSSSEASPDMGDPVQPQQGSMAGPKPRQGQMSPSQMKVRQRIYELQNQLLAGQNIVESTENVLSQTVASHKQERKRLTDEPERANAVIDDLTQEIERLEAQLQVTEEPCRHEQAEVTRLQDMLEQSRAEVATLRQDLEQRLQALGYSEAGSAELLKMFDRVDEYREENHHLKQGIIGLEGEIDELNSELDFLRTAYANLRENQNDPEGIALDLRLCQAQLGQQILALTTHLQNETARFEQARTENLAVIEAQRARITQLESEKTQWEMDKDRLLKYQQELYNFGIDLSNRYNDLGDKYNQMYQERENLGIEVACLKEEKTYLEDSMTEQPRPTGLPKSRINVSRLMTTCDEITPY
ncbi:myosin-9-like [Paramacrobiotus metropolitanus]|uniref:myosin-9-like n=1 Tax=Paramacrobiotus metropolitanus TaxID=2943436 RepID=UPI0024459AA5|nr:myosin-9-like [Paramacrobiotus metropolitanus]